MAAAVCLVVVILAMTAVAQEPATHAGGLAVAGLPLPFGLRESYGLSWRDGRMVAAGASYKAIFTDGGMEFTPCLGRAALRNYPLRLRLDSIRRGNGEVPLFLRRPDSPRLDDGSAAYDVAPGLTERYRVNADGVELSYTFANWVAGSGDLVVRLRHDSDLVAVGSQPGKDGLLFAAESLGGVSIGGVCGIDAAGRRIPGGIRIAGEVLELTLPGAFVDAASYPFVLDPMIGTSFHIGDAGIPATSPDVAYDQTNDVYLAVWEQYYSATDIDIRAQRIDSAGRLLGSVLVLTYGSTSERNATVGSVNATDRFLVCWQQGPGFFGPWDLRGLCVTAADGTWSPESALATQLAEDEIEPDAASQSSTATDQVLVVYRSVTTNTSAAAVVAVRCARSGAPTVGQPAPLFGPSTFSPVQAVAISKGGGSRYVATWSRFDSVLGRYSVEAACLDPGGQRLGSAMTVGTFGGPRSRPDVDGDGTDFVVAWETPEAGASLEHDIYSAALRWDSRASALVRGTIAGLAVTPNVDEATPAVTWIGVSSSQGGFVPGKSIVAWAEEDFSQPQTLLPWYALRVMTLQLRTCKPCSTPDKWLAPVPFLVDPQIASRQSGGGLFDDALIVCSGLGAVPPFAGELYGIRYEAFGSGGAVNNVGGGCGNAGLINASGAFALGNTNFSLTLAGFPQTTAAASLILGSPAAAPLMCGTCAITPPLSVLPGTFVPFGGWYTVSLPVPCDTALYNGVIRAQWVLAGAGSSCSSQFAFTDRLDCAVGL